MFFFDTKCFTMAFSKYFYVFIYHSQAGKKPSTWYIIAYCRRWIWPHLFLLSSQISPTRCAVSFFYGTTVAWNIIIIITLRLFLFSPLFFTIIFFKINCWRRSDTQWHIGMNITRGYMCVRMSTEYFIKWLLKATN